jgi:hypothetical protein
LCHFPHWQGFISYTHWLSLGKEYAVIASNYSQDRRVNLKRSAVQEWQIEISEDARPLLNLFRENHEQQIVGGVRRKTYDTLSILLRYLVSQGYGEIWYAARAGEKAAGVFIQKVGGKAIYIFNAANKDGRRGNARTFLLDHYFRNYAGEDLIFDFESPDVPAIASFYRSFGAEPQALLSIKKDMLPFPLKQLRRVRGMLLKIRRGLIMPSFFKTRLFL